MTITDFLVKNHIKFKNINLYQEACSHPSFKQETHLTIDYDRLEYLGDAVLGLSVATLAYNLRKDLDEGGLTKLRASLVNTASLSSIALALGLQETISIGASMTKDELLVHPKILENVFEALIGALYLDLGFQESKNFLEKIFMNQVLTFSVETIKDYKSTLQEKLQSDKRDNIIYRLLEQSGPSHEPTFTVAVSFAGITLGTGKGKTKKEAEQNAAKEALAKEANSGLI